METPSSLLQRSVLETMATKSVQIQMKELLDEFDREVKETVKEAAQETAKECVQKLKATSPKRKGRGKGKYARSWTQKKDGNGYVVYNKEYQLTHLLENGHAVANQYGDYGHPNGRVAGQRHIAPVEEEGIENFEARISRGISK